MAEEAVRAYAQEDEEEQRSGMAGAAMSLLSGIEGTLRDGGTAPQRVLSILLLALLGAARLPGGGYC